MHVRRQLAVYLGIAILAAALPLTAVAQDTGATATNVAPQVTAVTLNSGAAITPTAGGTKSVPLAITATDSNGYADITSITFVVKNPSLATYVSSTSVDLTACTRSGDTVSCSVTWSLAFHADPGTYTVNVTATDAASATGTLGDTETVNELVALNLAASALSFGSLAPGATSTTQTLGVTNYGNVVIDVQVSGTALTLASPSASIPVGSIKHSLNSDMTSSAALTGSAVTVTAFDLAKGAASSKNTYWTLTMPTGSSQYIPPGAYAGTITVAAIKSA